MSFTVDCRDLGRKVSGSLGAVFNATADAVKDSIVEGSVVTGAPGQPVGETGELRDSWEMEHESPGVIVISSDDEAAPYIENDVRHAQYQNHGAHSVALTVAGFDRIVALEASRHPRGAA